jgi:hypothetical protein
LAKIALVELGTSERRLKMEWERLQVTHKGKIRRNRKLGEKQVLNITE